MGVFNSKTLRKGFLGSKYTLFTKYKSDMGISDCSISILLFATKYMNYIVSGC